MHDSTDTHVYAPPSADLQLPAGAENGHAFFPVSRRKFFIMAVGSFGIYTYYWFYRHWHFRRLHAREKVWPVVRTILMLFYIHTLCKRVESVLEQRGSRFAFTAAGASIPLIVALLVNKAADRLNRMDPGAALVILGLVMVPVTACVAWRIQNAANIANGDAAGSNNGNLSLANAFWLVVGVLLWTAHLIRVVPPLYYD